MIVSTATAAPPGKAELINGHCAPEPNNPHSWLPLLGNARGFEGDRVMRGVLRRRYRDHVNDAVPFLEAKVRPVRTADHHQVTAARHEMLAPAEADDSFADPWLFAARVDREIAAHGDASAPLLGYATITPDSIASLHDFHEEVRCMARDLVSRFATPVLVVQHAPARAGSQPAACSSAAVLSCRKPHRLLRDGQGAHRGQGAAGDRQCVDGAATLRVTNSPSSAVQDALAIMAPMPISPPARWRHSPAGGRRVRREKARCSAASTERATVGAGTYGRWAKASPPSR